MAEEFDNYDARMDEVHRTVERWEADRRLGVDDRRAPGSGATDEPEDQSRETGGDH